MVSASVGLWSKQRRPVCPLVPFPRPLLSRSTFSLLLSCRAHQIPSKMSRKSSITSTTEAAGRKEDPLFVDYQGHLHMYKELLRPIEEPLRQLRGPPSFDMEVDPEQRALKQTKWKLDRIKNEFFEVATFIDRIVQKLPTPEERTKLQGHLFKFVSDSFCWKRDEGINEPWDNLVKLWNVHVEYGEKGKRTSSKNEAAITSSKAVIPPIDTRAVGQAEAKRKLDNTILTPPPSAKRQALNFGL